MLLPKLSMMEFKQIQGEILRKDLVLDLEETYAYVRRDSVRRATLNGESNHPESSAMVAHRAKPYCGESEPTKSRIRSSI
ncbi:hypothetical protein ACOSP7_031976 [Xanthoceras sorbifolium]